MSAASSPRGAVDPRYVAARRALLDALEALAAHRRALVVVGAQAIYLRTGAGEIGIAPFTTDGDVALDPSLLSDEPLLEAAMKGAGFTLLEPHPDGAEPGMWVRRVDVAGEELVVPVDLLVPDGVAAGGGRRGARLGPHGPRAARRATGLEAALVDHDQMTIAALEEGDRRSFDVRVGGVTALLVAKAHKIHDRLASGRPGRADDKDAADVYRLFQTTRPARVADRMDELRRHPVAGPPTRAAIEYLAELFGRRSAAGTAMAVRALRFAVPEDEVVAVATAYVRRLASGPGDQR
ncbi:MAG TPA: hypothetical protein VGW75_17900 [Solirubrobacteraceae bacterium]|nr:hypothetical protein [Solirubrobacteraceae bacterium]